MSLLKSPNSSTPSAAKIKKRSMKRRPRFPTCRKTTGSGRDSVRGVLPTWKKKRIEINVLRSKSTHKKMYGRYGFTWPLTEILKHIWDAVFSQVQTLPLLLYQLEHFESTHHLSELTPSCSKCNALLFEGERGMQIRAGREGKKAHGKTAAGTEQNIPKKRNACG